MRYAVIFGVGDQMHERHRCPDPYDDQSEIEQHEGTRGDRLAQAEALDDGSSASCSWIYDPSIG